VIVHVIVLYGLALVTLTSTWWVTTFAIKEKHDIRGAEQGSLIGALGVYAGIAFALCVISWFITNIGIE
jgi:hypothetical protein